MKQYKLMKVESRHWVLPEVLSWLYVRNFAVLLLEVLDNSFVKIAKCKNVLFNELVDQLHNTSFLFLSFRRVLNVNYSFLGNSPASEF